MDYESYPSMNGKFIKHCCQVTTLEVIIKEVIIKQIQGESGYSSKTKVNNHYFETYSV